MNGVGCIYVSLLLLLLSAAIVMSTPSSTPATTSTSASGVAVTTKVVTTDELMNTFFNEVGQLERRAEVRTQQHTAHDAARTHTSCTQIHTDVDWTARRCAIGLITDVRTCYVHV